MFSLSGGSNDLIERLDLDRIDVDNFSAVLIRCFQRRARRERCQSALERWWLRARGRWLRRWLRPAEQLHLVVVGRR